MRFVYYICVVFCTSVILASCAKDPISVLVDESGRIPMNISGILDAGGTKVSDSGFSDKDAVGLFAVNYCEGNMVPGELRTTGNQSDNIKYSFDGDLGVWSSLKKAYFKDASTNVDIYLYSPYQLSIGDINREGFEVRKDQRVLSTPGTPEGYEASDFMWGKAVNVIPSSSSVPIMMSHRLSSVRVNLIEGAGFGDNEFDDLFKSVLVASTTRKAEIDFSTGVATPIGAPQKDGIVMREQENGSFQAVVVPQTVSGGTVLFIITIDGISYNFSHSGDVSYSPGKKLEFNIKVDRKDPSGIVDLSLSSIELIDWIEVVKHHGEQAREYYVVDIKEKNTLGRTIKNAGKDPDKIRNLKITGIISNNDYYFIRDSMKILESLNLKEVETYGALESESASVGSLAFARYSEKYGKPDRIIGNEAYWDFVEKGIIPVEALFGKKSLLSFTFPEFVDRIGDRALANTNITGQMVLPNDLKLIGKQAFEGTQILGVTFNDRLFEIGDGAFAYCRALTGDLILPESLETIGATAFASCNFYGTLSLPNSIVRIGNSAFYNSGVFTQGLTIPEKITELESAFRETKFTGVLNLNNVTRIKGDDCFWNCGFSGDLVIPEGVMSIPQKTFRSCNFVSVSFPESLINIYASAFHSNDCLSSVSFGNNLILIESEAFSQCGSILSLTLPESICAIGEKAFQNCYYLSRMVCKAVEPPVVRPGAFEGVAKDNFTLEVPPESVKRYQMDPVWNEFRRISSHYDFSIGRDRLRALNKGKSQTFTLRCPSDRSWSIKTKPDWVSVQPDHGSGRTEVTITIENMPHTEQTFGVNDGTFNNPDYHYYKGRSGELVFTIQDLEYHSSMTIEQYDSEFYDGMVSVMKQSSKSRCASLVFVGDGYDACDIVNGTFMEKSIEGSEGLFSVEPYSTYADCFNVYSIITESNDSGIETVNTNLSNRFINNGILDSDACFSWIRQNIPEIDFTNSAVVLLLNGMENHSQTSLYLDGSSLSAISAFQQSYPMDFKGVIRHEVGGHAFGRLADETVAINNFISECSCHNDHPNEPNSQYDLFKSKGWYRNITTNSDYRDVPWSHLMFDPRYSDTVDIFEGAYFHGRGIYRSEASSCMSNYSPYFPAIGRQAIVERIMECIGEEFSLEKFYSFDRGSSNADTKSFCAGNHMGCELSGNVYNMKESVIYAGEHPNIK